MAPVGNDSTIQLPSDMSSTATNLPYSPYESPARVLRASVNPTVEAIKLAMQLATDILLDRQLKPKRPIYRYNELPPLCEHNSQAIEELRSEYRRTLCTLIQRIQQTFGPNVTSYSDPKKAFTEFIEECKKVNTICEPTSALSLATAFQSLELLYKKFTAWLKKYHDALMTTELSLRFKLARKNGAQVSREDSKNFYFMREKFYMLYQDDSGKTVHKDLYILPIFEENLRQRLLEECLQHRYGHTDRFHIHTILYKKVEHCGTPSTQLNTLAVALKNQYKVSNLSGICKEIDEQAKIIIRRFGPDYFFDDNSTFTAYLPLWAHRYGKIGELLAKGNVAVETLSRKIRNRLLDMLYFLEISHAALLEKEVDKRIEEAVGLLGPDLQFVQAVNQKFTVWRGEVVMKPAPEDNCRETLDVLVRNMKDMQMADESLDESDRPQEDKDSRASRKDLLEDDEMTDEESGSDSERSDKMYPRLEDTILSPTWNTKPGNGKLASHVSGKLCGVGVTSILGHSLQPPLVNPAQKGGRGLLRKNPTETSRPKKFDSPFSSAFSSPNISPKRKPNRPTQSHPGSPLAPAGIMKAATKNARSRTNTALSISRGEAMQVDDDSNGERTVCEGPSEEIDKNGAREVHSPMSFKYLSDRSISASALFTQHPRFSSPYFASAPDFSFQGVDKAMSDESTQPLPNNSLPAYKRNSIARQLVDELLRTEFGNDEVPYPPPKYTPAKRDDKPLGPDWASKPMLPPSGLDSWSEWTPDYRATPDMVADIEFNSMSDRTYD